MKKKLCILAVVLLLMLSLVACDNNIENSSEEPEKKHSEASSEESSEHTTSERTASVIFDHTEAQGETSYSIDEFPNITFIKNGGSVSAYNSITDTTEILYSGMPVWNIYFYDVTLDGIPDICSTVSIGSGWIDERIMIYDYQSKTAYTIVDRFNTNYALQYENGVLYLYSSPSEEFNYSKLCPIEDADYKEVTEDQ